MRYDLTKSHYPFQLSFTSENSSMHSNKVHYNEEKTVETICVLIKHIFKCIPDISNESQN